MDTTPCPHCGGQAQTDFQTRTGETTTFCDRCGYFHDDSDGPAGESTPTGVLRLTVPSGMSQVFFLAQDADLAGLRAEIPQDEALTPGGHAHALTSPPGGPRMSPTHVITFACRTEEEGSLYLGTPEFASSWKEARATAFQRLLGNIGTDTTQPDPDMPTLEQLGALFPEDEPQDFDVAHSGPEGVWIVGVTALL